MTDAAFIPRNLPVAGFAFFWRAALDRRFLSLI
jgi:hypothetical protein